MSNQLPQYPTPWLFNDKGDPKLLSAEQWLLQEAEIDATVADEDEERDDDCPPRHETMRKIVDEIRQLRAAYESQEGIAQAARDFHAGKISLHEFGEAMDDLTFGTENTTP